MDPVEGLQLQFLKALPSSLRLRTLCLVQRVHALCEGVVVAVSDTADRGLNAGRFKVGRVSIRNVLRASVAVMNELILDIQRLYDLPQRRERNARVERRGDAPADDRPGENVDDERT